MEGVSASPQLPTDNSIDGPLAECFLQVFPDLAASDAASATMLDTAGWDSLAHVTLVCLIAERFGLDADFELFQDATSFAAVRSVVAEHRRGA